MPDLIYKICTIDEWTIADMTGVFEGSDVDLADGYIHFSTDTTVAETAAKYFSGQDDLLLVSVEPSRFGPELKWEPARDGTLFPHLYTSLSTDLVEWVIPMPIGETGEHVLPELDE